MQKLVAVAALCWILAGACGGGSSPGPTVAPPSATAIELFDFVWDDARVRFRSRLSAGSTDSELFNVVSAMFPENFTDMDFVLAQMPGIRGLNVDIRSNGGGNDQNGEAIVGRFVDESREYRRVRSRY